MTEPTQIKIIQKKGEPLQVEVLNVAGSTCTEITAPLAQLGVTTSQQLKPEYYEEETVDSLSSSDISL